LDERNNFNRRKSHDDLENQNERFVGTNDLNRQIRKLTFEYKNMINKSKLIIVSLIILIFTALSAFASPRVYVAASGSDANFICALPTLPCRTISKALLFADDGGEVIITESGDYDTFSVVKSVTVAAAPGVNAGIVSSRSFAVVIGQEATVRAVKILNLNFLNINTAEPTQGINDITAANLYVENCTFTGFSSGIRATIGGMNAGKLSVRNSTFRKNDKGVDVIDSGLIQSTFNVLVDSCKFEHNKIGVYLGGQLNASILNSVMSDNDDYGIQLLTPKGSRTEAVVDNCLLTNNNAGIGAYGANGAIAYLTRSTVTQNIAEGVHVGSGGTVYSFQNNTISGNFPDVSGNMTPVTLR